MKLEPYLKYYKWPLLFLLGLFAASVFAYSVFAIYDWTQNPLWLFGLGPSPSYPSAIHTRAVQELGVGSIKIQAEVVVLSADIKQGLSDRESMDRNKGMLFELGRRDLYPFWMNRMHFPLDIIWIDGDTVVEIAENLPPPKFGEIPYTHHPKVDADRVLEVNAGVVREANLKVGDEIGGLTNP
ncbi:DUF192 domain-containing protein [Patescibacteria group bacterium]|jgi:uncharacterized membrane protein (UPF0127 family)|nr:DUF192 domain-containing protein [Patescibacteria group bacterium]